MIIPNELWSTDKPTSKRILAKLSKSFTTSDDCYDILWWYPFYDLMHPAGYYDCHGDNVPYSAIEKWIEF